VLQEDKLMSISREFKTALAPPYIAQVSAKLHSPGSPGGIIIGRSFSSPFQSLEALLHLVEMKI
jgi:hypothetical protein